MDVWVITLNVHSEYLCSSEFNNECLMHKHTHTDKSRTGSSLQEEGAGIIHDDTSGLIVCVLTVMAPGMDALVRQK